MVRGRFGNVDLLLSTEQSRSIFSPRLLDALHDALAERELSLTLTKLPDDKLTDDGYVPRMLREIAADGVLINYNAHIPSRMIELIEQYQLPSIWMNSKRDHDAAYPDDFNAAAQVTRYLLGMGHRRIAYADYQHDESETPAHYSQTDRQRGYQQAMRDAGLEPVRLGSPWQRPGNGMVLNMIGNLREPDRPTAIIAYGPQEARASIAAAMVEKLDVPKDLSVVTFADGPTHDVGPRITTMLIPQAAMGGLAVDMLVQKIDSPETPLKPYPVPFTLFEADSCRPPRERIR